jgi:hypothetical protein
LSHHSDPTDTEAVAVVEVVASVETGDQADVYRYQLFASLSVGLSDGRQVATGLRDFIWSGPRRGLGAIYHRYRGPRLSENSAEQERLLEATYHFGMDDVKDAVNQALGRDPEQHRPPRLSWGRLLEALKTEGIAATEEQLIAAPLRLELSDRVKTEIGAR